MRWMGRVALRVRKPLRTYPADAGVETGAVDGDRTHDIQLGKLVPAPGAAAASPP